MVPSVFNIEKIFQRRVFRNVGTHAILEYRPTKGLPFSLLLLRWIACSWQVLRSWRSLLLAKSFWTKPVSLFTSVRADVSCVGGSTADKSNGTPKNGTLRNRAWATAIFSAMLLIPLNLQLRVEAAPVDETTPVTQTVRTYSAQVPISPNDPIDSSASTTTTTIDPVSATTATTCPASAAETLVSDLGSVSALPDEVQEQLSEGTKLESEQRWTEALNLYEEALHRYPKVPQIRQCFNRCRCHHELARRYVDPSFRESIRTSSPQATLRIYEEVLSKISTYYVEMPSWNELFGRASQAFDWALDDPQFRHVWPQLTDENIRIFRAGRGEWMKGLPLNRQSDVIVAARQMGDLVEKQLQLPMQAMLFEFIAGTVGTLDPYSAFLTPNQLRDLFGQIDGNFVGIGVELRIFSDRLVVTRVLPESPAQKGGVLVGDRLVSVDGYRWNEMTIEQLANRLQGLSGSSVRVELDRENESVRSVTLQRERVEVPSVEDMKFIDSAQGIAYLKLTGFQRTTRRDLENALWSLYREGMRALVIDVRGNPGGLLPASVEAVDLFVRQGTIVSTRGRNPSEDVVYDAREPNTWRVPLIVLVDENSASASEIFAGAIHQLGRGTIVGTRSYGKGSVQSVVPLLTCGAGLRLTTARFYSPKGEAYQDMGVSPDVLVHTAAKPLTSRVDPSTNRGTDTVATESAANAPVTAGNGEPTMDAALNVAAEAANAAEANQSPRVAELSPQRIPMQSDPVIVAAIECFTRQQAERLSEAKTSSVP